MSEKANILPDCRANEAKGRVFKGSMSWVPVFCANCGRDGGLCPEGMGFIFYLCNTCVSRYGEIAGTMMMPDEVFWEKVQQAQIEEYGRQLTFEELQRVVQEGASPLATLLSERR